MDATPTALMVHPSSELYGSDRMFAESVRALADDGWRVVSVLPEDGPLAAVLRSCGAEVSFCRTAVLEKAALRPAGFLRLLGLVVRSLLPMVRLLRTEHPDLVFVNTVTVPLWVVVARLLRLRVVVHVHEAEDAAPRPVRAALAAPLLAAHVVIVNSEAAARSLGGAVRRLATKARLVYNGVAGPTQLPERPAAPGDGYRLVLVGRLSPRKGSDVAVAAVERLHSAGRRVSLDLVGSAFTGYEWFERELVERIGAAGLRDHVRLRGFRADVWQAYANADIALVPSRLEPFGNVSVEAQLAGVPVIVSDAQGLPETVAHGKYGTVVSADDPDALADAVMRMMDDWDAACQTARAARAEARTRFSPERYRADIAAIAADLRC